MKSLRLLVLIILAGCTTTESDTGMFRDLVDQQDVVIALSDYKLDSIPPDIGQLKNAKTLSISKGKQGWTILPPLWALNERIDQPPFGILPDEITALKDLKKLTVFGLNIRTLPEDIVRLQNLEDLNLAFNKLTVSNEIEKLRALKNLKHLYLIGNRIDTTEVERWQKEQPDLQIIFRGD